MSKEGIVRYFGNQIVETFKQFAFFTQTLYVLKTKKIKKVKIIVPHMGSKM